MAGIKFFVELADQADAKLKEIDEEALKEIRFYREQMENNKQRREPADVKLKTGLKLATLGVSYASIVAASFVVEGMVIDVMRIGEGWEDGGWGKAQNILRGLAILGPALKVAGAGANTALPAVRNLSGLVKTVDFNSKLGNCSWIAAARAIRLSGQRVFVTVEDLARAKGLSAAATDVVQVTDLSYYHQVFQKLKISFSQSQLRAAAQMGSRSVATWAELENAARAVDGDVIMFTARWTESKMVNGVLNINVNRHAMLARKVGSGMQIIDRTGKTYSSIAEVPYSGIATALPEIDLLVIPNAAVVPTAGTVASITPNLLNVLAVQVVPTVITPRKPGGQ